MEQEFLQIMIVIMSCELLVNARGSLIEMVEKRAVRM
jgi:hypothetical protein